MIKRLIAFLTRRFRKPKAKPVKTFESIIADGYELSCEPLMVREINGRIAVEGIDYVLDSDNPSMIYFKKGFEGSITYRRKS